MWLGRFALEDGKHLGLEWFLFYLPFYAKVLLLSEFQRHVVDPFLLIVFIYLLGHFIDDILAFI